MQQKKKAKVLSTIPIEGALRGGDAKGARAPNGGAQEAVSPRKKGSDA